MFKSLTVYQLTAPARAFAAAVSERLANKPFEHCLPSFPMSRGWVPPLEGGEEMAYAANGATLFCLRTDIKTVPASAVRERVEEARRNAEREGELLTPMDIVMLTVQITEGFLPGIPPATKLTYAYIDSVLGMLFLGATGAAADDFMSLLKETLGASVPAALLGIDGDPCSFFTRWVLEPDYYPLGDFTLGTLWSLENLDGDGGVINLKNEEVDSAVMRDLIRDGRRVCSITLCSENVDFRLTSTLGLRNISIANSNKHNPLDEEFVLFAANMRDAMSKLDPLLGGWVRQESLDFSELQQLLEKGNVTIERS